MQILPTRFVRSRRKGFADMAQLGSAHQLEGPPPLHHGPPVLDGNTTRSRPGESCDTSVSPNKITRGGRIWVSDSDAARLRTIPHFEDSNRSELDINKSFGWYVTHVVEQIFKFERDLRIRSIADIGTGYGWLAIAFALNTEARVVAVEPDARRLAAARQIAGVFGVADRIQWCVGSIGKLPFADQEIDATFCLEVIEHTGDDLGLVRDIARITRELLVITTPNKLFPLDVHDTFLPFCHWLPPGWPRDWYATVFGRRAFQDNNRFWSPAKLLRALADFERESRFLQFKNYQHYAEAERRLDYKNRGLSRAMLQSYHRAASWTGRASFYLLPNLASTYRRRPHTRILTDRGKHPAEHQRRD